MNTHYRDDTADKAIANAERGIKRAAKKLWRSMQNAAKMQGFSIAPPITLQHTQTGAKIELRPKD